MAANWNVPAALTDLKTKSIFVRWVKNGIQTVFVVRLATLNYPAGTLKRTVCCFAKTTIGPSSGNRVNNAER